MANLVEDLRRSVGRLVTTHCSWVFLGEERVVKVKRPVDLGFLDYSTPSRRRWACAEEVRINRRLAPDVYRGVVPIRLEDAGKSAVESAQSGGRRHVVGEPVDEPGALEELERREGAGIVDWGVEMRRLPEDRRADHLLAEGSLDRSRIEALAARLAAFHAESQTGPGIDEHGSLEVVRAHVEENFEQTRGVLERWLGPAEARELRRRQRSLLARHPSRFRRRRRAGRIRDGHGDLRLEHVYYEESGGVAPDRVAPDRVAPDRVAPDRVAPDRVAPDRVAPDRVAPATGRITIVDGVEFDIAYRAEDTAADLAFLAMDLAWRGAVELAETLLATYAREAGDPGLYPVIDFWESYRATVRGKVAALVAADPGVDAPERDRAEAEARRYFLLALAAERRPVVPPMLVAVGGWIASGKSTVARALGAELALPVLEADRVRKQLLGVDPRTPLRDAPFSGAYDQRTSRRVFGRLLRGAAEILVSGRTVIVDTSMRSRRTRRHFRRLADRLGVPLLVVECRAPRELCRERLRRREREGSGASDAGSSDGRLEIFDRWLERWEQVDELEAAEHLVLDTSRPLEESLAEVRGRIPGWPRGAETGPSGP